MIRTAIWLLVGLLALAVLAMMLTIATPEQPPDAPFACRWLLLGCE